MFLLVGYWHAMLFDTGTASMPEQVLAPELAEALISTQEDTLRPCQIRDFDHSGINGAAYGCLYSFFSRAMRPTGRK